jgi:FkbM family methyltransferase
MRKEIISLTVRLVPFSLREKIRKIPGIASLQRTILSVTLDGLDFEHLVDAGPAKGITFHITMPEDKGILTGTYEVAFATRLAQAVKPGIVAYDIGSWHGFFAGVMAAQNAREVHVFEPLPANAERIRRLAELNPAHTIKLHACAVGDSDSEMDLLIMPETSMAKLEVSSFQAKETSARRERIKVRSLDAMIDAGEISPPALIKMDVEGAEALVLRGAAKTIHRHKPLIFAEIHSAFLLDECRQLLEVEGYNIEFLSGALPQASGAGVCQIMAAPSTAA